MIKGVDYTGITVAPFLHDGGEITYLDFAQINVVMSKVAGNQPVAEVLILVRL